MQAAGTCLRILERARDVTVVSRPVCEEAVTGEAGDLPARVMDGAQAAAKGQVQRVTKLLDAVGPLAAQRFGERRKVRDVSEENGSAEGCAGSAGGAIIEAPNTPEKSSGSEALEKFHENLIQRTRAGLHHNRAVAGPRWLGGRDSNPDNVVQSHVSYR